MKSFLSSLPLIIFSLFVLFPGNGICAKLASNNIPLDSPVYLYLEKLAGQGLIKSDMKNLKPFSKAEAARLTIEAESNLTTIDDGETLVFARQIINRLHDLIPRELSLYREPEKSQWLDINPMSFSRLRYVYLDGVPRNYARYARDPGHQSYLGFLGGDLRHDFSPIVHQAGTEGTPLLENNEGVTYRRGNNVDFRMGAEAFIKNMIAFDLEPVFLNEPGASKNGRSSQLELEQGYMKLGWGGLELEAGRDANWFGPGYRGALTLSNNAKNFDLIKLSSPEPLDVKWIKKYVGEVKYSIIFSRFDESGSGKNLRRPYFLAMKLAFKPLPWFEVGGNFVRQQGGPGFSGKTRIMDFIFGGGDTNKSNSIAGFDVRFRIPWLRNTEIYSEYVGEDSCIFGPFVESYIAGFYIPRLTASGKDDLRFEYFWGHQILYTDAKFPNGYTYHNMPVGDSQGGGSTEFYLRYSHWFSVRNNLAIECYHTERGNVGRITVDGSGKYDPNGVLQAVERKNSVRISWNVPLYGETDLNLMYGFERINNLNLVQGVDRSNQIFKLDLSYRY